MTSHNTEGTIPVFRICCLILLVAGLATSSAFAQSTGSAGLPPDAALHRLGLTRAWWGHSVTNSTRDKIIHVTLDETSYFAQSTNGVITAFDSETGRRLWAIQVGAADRTIYPASSNDELLFVVSGMTLYAITKSTGNILWGLALPGQPSSSPVADGRRLFLGFLDGSEYAFDFKKITDLQQKGLMPDWSYLTVMWRFKTAKAIIAPAVPNGRLVAFASTSGSLYSVGAEERDLVFQFETDAPLSAPIARYKNQLILASEDFNVYSVNIDNGKSNWRFSTGLIIRKAPVVIKDELYLTPEHGGIIKLSPVTGKRIWSRPGVVDFVSASSQHVYGTDALNNLVVMSRVDGAVLGTVPMDRMRLHVVNDRSDRLYFSTQGGLIVCLRETDREFPIFHQHPERRLITPEFAPEEPEGEPMATEPATTEQTEATQPPAPRTP